MFNFGKKKTSNNIVSPMQGKLMKIEDVCDPVFADKLMGDGFAVDLEDSVVVSPVDGTIISMFPSGHAYGIQSDDGKEILIHIGIDTVELGNKAFDIKVSQGQKVKKGDTLVIVNLEVIKESGKSLHSPIIFTSGESIAVLKDGQSVERLEEVASIK